MERNRGSDLVGSILCNLIYIILPTFVGGREKPMAMIPANEWESADTTLAWGISLIYLLSKFAPSGYTILREDYDKFIEEFESERGTQAVLSVTTDYKTIKLNIIENTENLRPFTHYIGALGAKTYEEAERTADKV